MGDGIVKFFYILVGVLFSCSINSWQRNIEVFNYNFGLVCHFFQFYQFFASHILQLCCLMHIHLGLLCLPGRLPFYFYVMSLSVSLVIFLALKSTLSDFLKLIFDSLIWGFYNWGYFSLLFLRNILFECKEEFLWKTAGR